VEIKVQHAKGAAFTDALSIKNLMKHKSLFKMVMFQLGKIPEPLAAGFQLSVCHMRPSLKFLEDFFMIGSDQKKKGVIQAAGARHRR
jgi:hypothetical protein